MNTLKYSQKWSPIKLLSYLVYFFFAKHLPNEGEFGFFGLLSNRFRSAVCKNFIRSAAKTIGIGKGADIGNGASLIMDDCANIGAYALISGTYATLTIGKHVMMGQHCTIILQNHKYLEEGYAGDEGKNVIIDDFAWLGHHVIVLPGVRVGKHAIIGAGAVVTKNIPDYAIAVGNPAVVKKYRKQM